MTSLTTNIAERAASVTTIIGWTAALIGLYYANRRHKHAVQVASQRNRRAEIELAIRQCTHFGTVLLPKMANLRQELEKAAPNYFTRFKCIKGKGRIDPDDKEVTREDIDALRPYRTSIAEVLNSIEAFAIPFATNVADDRIGYIECAPAFLRLFEMNFALYSRVDLKCMLLATQHVYFRWKEQEETLQRQLKLEATGEAFFAATKELIEKDSRTRHSWLALAWCQLLEFLLKKARR